MDMYFDNAAAVPVSKAVLDGFQFLSGKFYANQESPGAGGVSCAEAVGNAAKELCKAFFPVSDDTDVFFTNTGTDAMNAVFFSLQKKFPDGGTILCNDGEHSALFSALERQADKFKIRKIPLKRSGHIDLDSMNSALLEDVVLVAVHHVQSETGIIQDLCEVRRLLDSAGSKAVFLSDTIQSACKIAIPWKEAGLDFGIISGQKIGAVSGGALFFRKSIFLKYIKGLRNENHLLGRVTPAIILSLVGHSCELIKNINVNAERMRFLKEIFCGRLSGKLWGKYEVTVADNETSPYILNILLHGVQGAIITRALKSRGISVAPGSACDSETDEPSRVLKAMGLKKKDAYTALRISFFLHNTADEVIHLADELSDVVINY